MATAGLEVLAPFTPANPPATSAEKGRVLVAEDDSVYQHALQHLLHAKGYSVEVVSDGLQALNTANSGNPPRLLILDWMMPGLQGPEVCRQIRERAGENYQYILLLTAKQTPADIVEGLEAGADDYLVKPFNAHELLARVRVGERMLKLHDRLLAAQASLRFQATHDPLTGIWNRSALFDLLNAEFERASRKATLISLFLIDVDQFKRVNDIYGHLTGDAILREIAHRLGAAIRPYDIIGRYGGEEFIVAASELNPQAALSFAERLREEVGSSPIRTTDGAVAVTVSVGVATSIAPVNYSLQTLIQSADSELYRAKRNGRNRVETIQLNRS